MCARRAVDMQESSVWGVHQTHSATRDDDGRERKGDQTESQEARAHTQPHHRSRRGVELGKQLGPSQDAIILLLS